MVICIFFRINSESTRSSGLLHIVKYYSAYHSNLLYTCMLKLLMFLHQIPWAKVRQTHYSLFKPLFSDCVCKEIITGKDTMSKHDPLMGRPEQNSRDMAYTLHQNQEVQVYGASSASNLSFKSLILALVSRILIYVYFKLR